MKISIRNTDTEKWDKPIIEAENPDDYYRAMLDKRIFYTADVILVEEPEQYTLIKISGNMQLIEKSAGTLKEKVLM